MSNNPLDVISLISDYYNGDAMTQIPTSALGTPHAHIPHDETAI